LKKIWSGRGGIWTMAAERGKDLCVNKKGGKMAKKKKKKKDKTKKKKKKNKKKK